MYLIQERRRGGNGVITPLDSDIQSAVEAVCSGDCTDDDRILFINLIDYLRRHVDDRSIPGDVVICTCQDGSGLPLAHLIGCKRGSHTFYLRRVGGPEAHAPTCVHAREVCGEALREGDTSDIAVPLRLQDFVGLGPASASMSDGDVVATRKRCMAAQAARPRATLHALQNLTLAEARFDVLFDSFSSLPFQRMHQPLWPQPWMRSCLDLALADCPDRPRLPDIFLIDPPSIRRIQDQIGAHSGWSDVGYGHSVVSSISIDRERGTTLLSRTQKGVLVDTDLPCITTVTDEHRKPEAGPFLVTMSRRIASDMSVRIHAYARLILSKTHWLPLDAISERESAWDLLRWARRVASSGIRILVTRPLALRRETGTHPCLADFEVRIWLGGNLYVAFVEVNGDVGQGYWMAKQRPHREMERRGRLILDDRSTRGQARAAELLVEQLDEWIRDCAAEISSRGPSSHARRPIEGRLQAQRVATS